MDGWAGHGADRFEAADEGAWRRETPVLIGAEVGTLFEASSIWRCARRR
jgi:hypothetical protein